MGASFLTAELPGTLSVTELKARFHEMQDQDLFENGHSYSGGWGMARGLIVVRAPTDDAVGFLEKHCEKWGEARAVLFQGKWIIGALCAS